MKINNKIVLSVLIISYLYSFQNFSQLNNSSSEQKATITETQKNLNTYGFSDPNPVALIGHIYPYFRFDGYTDKGVMKSWKFVELENQFVKVSITPEIGGKIWGASKNQPISLLYISIMPSNLGTFPCVDLSLRAVLK